MTEETRIEDTVAAYYAQDQRRERIKNALASEDILSIENLAPYDEMHIGGRAATEYFTTQLQIESGMSLLDIGCGIGGAARYIASTTGAHVTGIDLTPDFCKLAMELAEKTGLAGRVHFDTGSALNLPYDDNKFDAAYTIHAAMNISDKRRLYTEIFRVMKSGSIFGIYDVMAEKNVLDLLYPVPWAEAPQSSFLISANHIKDLLQQAGFTILLHEDRTAFGIDMLYKMKQRMGDALPLAISNLIYNIESHCCRPEQIICRKP